VDRRTGAGRSKCAGGGVEQGSRKAGRNGAGSPARLSADSAGFLLAKEETPKNAEPGLAAQPDALRDPVAEALNKILAEREKEQKREARSALEEFDHKQWKNGLNHSPSRAPLTSGQEARSSSIWPWNDGLKPTPCTPALYAIGRKSRSTRCA
jgi:hypothetical protein